MEYREWIFIKSEKTNALEVINNFIHWIDKKEKI